MADAGQNKNSTFLLILIPSIILILGGGVGGAIYFGVIKIPGLAIGTQPVKKEDKKEAIVKKSPPPAAAPLKTPAPKVEKAIPPKPDPAKGYVKLATVWEGMEPEKLKEVVATWRDDDLAAVLNKMDEDKVSALLALMDPKKSSTVMKAMQTKAAEPDPPSSKKG